VKVVAMADLHGQLDKIVVPECDLLVLAGDICKNFKWNKNKDAHKQIRWLNEPFREWLIRAPAKHIVGIAGNHDWIFEVAPETVPTALPWTYLEDREVAIDGVVVYGSPWQPAFCGWAFNASEPELRRKFLGIPMNVDILLCHGPPFGHGDRVFDEGAHLGSHALALEIKEKKPTWCFFGHIHTGHHEISRLFDTKCRNVSLIDEQYELAFEPFVFEL